MPPSKKKTGVSQSTEMARSEKSPKLEKSPLMKAERIFYLGITVLTIIYICYSVYRDSCKYDGILNLYDFQPGWWWVGREQDISNFEWHYWYAMLWRITPWYVGHFALGRIVEWNCRQLKKVVFLSYSVLAICQLVGWRPVCLFVSHAAVMYLASLTNYAALVWIVSFGLLSTLNFEPFVSLMHNLVEKDEEESWLYLLMFTLALTNIRATSFCVERCWSHQTDSYDSAGNTASDQTRKTDLKGSRDPASPQGDVLEAQLEYGIIDLFFYLFYLPLFFTGPILTYDKFKEQMNRAPVPESWKRYLYQALNICRFIGWAMFCEFILHFLYFHSLQKSKAVLGAVPLFTLAGLGYCHGQFFMLKYHVMFGYPGSIARLDNMDPPAGPKCISYIYLYTDMWKYFDRGLYSFLKRYIYIPCGGSKSGAHRQIVASLVCFMYIFYWHGAEFYILMWILLNYIGVSLEKLGALITSWGPVQYLETNILSAAMVQRIHGFFSIPVFLVSCFSMFCFFGGHAVGYKFFERLILEGWLGSFVTLAFLVYCAIQNGIEVNRWTRNREIVKLKKS